MGACGISDKEMQGEEMEKQRLMEKEIHRETERDEKKNRYTPQWEGTVINEQGLGTIVHWRWGQGIQALV